MPRFSPAFSIALFAATTLHGAIVLSIDLNDAIDTPGDTAPSFASYTLSDDTLSIPPFSVDINPSHGASLDDTHRETPATSGGLSLGAIYRDFVFAAGDNTTNFYRVGIDASIGGLTPGKRYTVTAWSYDSGTAASRQSDWSLVGLGGPAFVVNNFVMNGAALPGDDTASRFSVTGIADSDGKLVLRGRPASASSNTQVFLNGFTVDEVPGTPVVATTVLAVDFNFRGAAGAGSTQGGFGEFLPPGSAGAPQSAGTQTFGAQTVTVAAAGTTLDDRSRATPVDSGPFTDSLLARDFIFGTTTGGIDATVQGLEANTAYLVEIWSFDSMSTTLRTSDWTVNGAQLWDDYAFNGNNLPATNNEGKMAGVFTTNASGELAIQGRADGATPAVFLNALRVSTLGPASIVDLGRPIISEFLADNGNGIVDEDGDLSDWIEIWNTTADTLNLEGWHLTDNSGDRSKWTFPAGTVLTSQSRLRIWASGKNRTADTAALHTNFAIGKTSGGYLALLQPGGATAATEFTALPSQRENISYGLAGTADPLTAGYFSPPTPGAANGTPLPGFVAETIPAIPRGYYESPFNVQVSCATPGAVIRYTTNGSVPTASSPVYPGGAGIPITTTTVLRTRAFASPLAPSETDTQTYVFKADVENQPAAPAGWPATWGTDSEVALNNGGNGTVPADYEMDPVVTGSTQPGYGVVEALGALPSLSISMEPANFHSTGAGIYTNPQSRGDSWERECSIEWIEPSGDGFQTECGIRLHGNSSRRPFRMQKHSFRLAFRAEYGDGRLDYKLFEDTTLKSFDKLVLHAFFTDGWGLVSWDQARYRPDDSLSFRDAFVKDCFADMGHARVSGSYTHLYINGLYWGVYRVGERVDDVWCADHLGGAETDWDVIAFGEGDYVRNGTAAAWDALFAFVNNSDMSVPANYLNVASQVDLANFIDYYLLHIHGNSEDWPNHNGYAVRNRNLAGAKWQFVAWDQELTFDPLVNVDRYSNNATKTTTDKTAGRLYQRLKASAEFRVLFGDRVHKHLNNGGALSVGAEQARWQECIDRLDKAIVAESARWGDTADATPYGNSVPAGEVFKRETDWLPTAMNVKNNHFPALHNTANSFATITELRTQNLYPMVLPPVFGQFGGNVPANYSLTITAPAGAIYYTVDGTDPRTAFTGTARGTLYSGPVTLSATGTVKARAFNGGQWSAVTEATFVVGTPASNTTLAVSELNYNPVVAEEEFIELMNYSEGTIDLTGVYFEGITFTFATGTLLAPGERILVVRDTTAFTARYGGTPRVAGQYEGALDNTGEEIAVIALNGLDIARFRYNDRIPWPQGADGGGRTMVLQRPGTDPTAPGNWRHSTAPGGAPGGSDSLPAFTGSALADADSDGFPALIEHVLNGSDSAQGDTRPLCTVEAIAVEGITSAYLVISAPVRLGADDVALSADHGTVPGAWSPAVFVSEILGTNGEATRKWRSPVPFGAAPDQFLRLRAVK